MLLRATGSARCVKPLILTSKSARKLSRSTVRRSQLENVLDGGAPQPVQVSKVSTTGIELADGLVITSSCIFLGGKVLLWKVPPTLWKDWDKDRFEVFEVAIPKPRMSIQASFPKTH